jgi:hypothetical protein
VALIKADCQPIGAEDMKAKDVAKQAKGGRKQQKQPPQGDAVVERSSDTVRAYVGTAEREGRHFVLVRAGECGS